VIYHTIIIRITVAFHWRPTVTTERRTVPVHPSTVTMNSTHFTGPLSPDLLVHARTDGSSVEGDDDSANDERSDDAKLNSLRWTAIAD